MTPDVDGAMPLAVPGITETPGIDDGVPEAGDAGTVGGTETCAGSLGRNPCCEVNGLFSSGKVASSFLTKRQFPDGSILYGNWQPQQHIAKKHEQTATATMISDRKHRFWRTGKLLLVVFFILILYKQE